MISYIYISRVHSLLLHLVCVGHVAVQWSSRVRTSVKTADSDLTSAGGFLDANININIYTRLLLLSTRSPRALDILSTHFTLLMLTGS